MGVDADRLSPCAGAGVPVAGRRVVEEDGGFLDPIYDYYDSHGLFVKEKEPFYTARSGSARLEPERES